MLHFDTYKVGQQLLILVLLITALSLPAVAGEQAAVAITLGTQGGPQPNPYRSQPANALQVNGETYLIDAGNGLARQLAAAGIEVVSVKKIFITHNHDDHNADVGTLMGLSWSLNNRDDFDVYGPAGIRQVMDGFLQSYAVNAAIRSEDSPLPRLGSFEGGVQIHPIGDATQAKVIYKDNNVQVSAIENCHYHHDEPVATKSGVEKSYAFRFETANRVVVFSGDTGPCPKLADFYQHADLLVHEVFHTELMADNFKSVKFMSHIPGFLLNKLMQKAERYHTTPEEVGKLAEAAKVKKVVLTHVMPGRQNDPDEAYTQGVRAHFKGEVEVAKDLGRY